MSVRPRPRGLQTILCLLGVVDPNRKKRDASGMLPVSQKLKLKRALTVANDGDGDKLLHPRMCSDAHKQLVKNEEEAGCTGALDFYNQACSAYYRCGWMTKCYPEWVFKPSVWIILRGAGGYEIVSSQSSLVPGCNYDRIGNERG
ncbi:hypothetical protein OESDEN_07505 [Oesophagostomum dentatum]|uniref:Uncharacterized protein n=1 Tax=Oesophagostomum dentatum TaxID=61180 RepID=A0A0B1T4W8_OESDE|nr:hypothetical protein OESDEN_07505 [Oesophagostomum dentatum]